MSVADAGQLVDATVYLRRLCKQRVQRNKRHDK